LLSQNILSQLRNFVEYISLKIFSNGRDIEISYENIGRALEFVKANGKYRFLNGFHKLLQITVSHYTLDEENSERLMLKYYEYLLKIRSFLIANYGLKVLNNIQEFPISVDSALKEWYLAGFFEQVKSRDFLTLTIQNSHEEDQIHRSPDHWDLERTGIRPESVGHLPQARHQRCDVLQLEKQVRWDER